MRSVLDDAKARQANQEYLAGATYPELAIHYKCGQRTLRVWFARLGLPTKRDVREYRTTGKAKIYKSKDRVSKDGPYGLYMRECLRLAERA